MNVAIFLGNSFVTNYIISMSQILDYSHLIRRVYLVVLFDCVCRMPPFQEEVCLVLEITALLGFSDHFLYRLLGLWTLNGLTAVNKLNWSPDL